MHATKTHFFYTILLLSLINNHHTLQGALELSDLRERLLQNDNYASQENLDQQLLYSTQDILDQQVLRATQNTWDQQLLHAVLEGDIDMVRNSLDAGANPNSSIVYRRNISNNTLTRLILDSKPCHFTMLSFAIATISYVLIIAVLAANNMDNQIYSLVPYIIAALCYPAKRTCKHYQNKKGSSCWEKKAIRATTEKTPLMIAAQKNSLQHDRIIDLLLDRKATIDVTDKNGNTALMHAIINNNIHATRILYLAGADPHHANIYHQTPLTEAANPTFRASNEIEKIICTIGKAKKIIATLQNLLTKDDFLIHYIPIHNITQIIVAYNLPLIQDTNTELDRYIIQLAQTNPLLRPLLSVATHGHSQGSQSSLLDQDTLFDHRQSFDQAPSEAAAIDYRALPYEHARSDNQRITYALEI